MMLTDTQQPAATFESDRERWFTDQFTRHMEDWERTKAASLSIMVTKGTLDWAYPPFIIASTATALGWDVTMFFTFYGLSLLRKDLDLKLSGLGNPAMPMKMPYGPPWFRNVEWQIPNLLMAGIPGFERMSTGMMRKTLKEHGIAPIAELRDICIEAEAKLIGCQMTRDLFGWDDQEFIPEVTEWAGAATYLANTRECRVNLYM